MRTAAEEFILKANLTSTEEWITFNEVRELMIGFAKYHVDAALNAANEDVRYDYSDIEIIQDLILSAYPESNII